MPNTVPYGFQGHLLGVQGADASGNPLPTASLVATLDDYADAYIAKDNANALWLIPRNPNSIPQGGSKTVNVTLTGTSQDGGALPSTQFLVVLEGAPIPPQATQIIVSSFGSLQMLSIPPDPGSATVTLQP
jgi:hypothetical protein